MRSTFAVMQSDRGDWVVTLSHHLGSYFSTPQTLGRHKSKTEALTSARTLAGRGGHVVEF